MCNVSSNIKNSVRFTTFLKAKLETFLNRQNNIGNSEVILGQILEIHVPLFYKAILEVPLNLRGNIETYSIYGAILETVWTSNGHIGKKVLHLNINIINIFLISRQGLKTC